ncbi:MAG: hypothetical protein ACTHJL_01950 [Amnibacterium sp.]
MRPAPDTAALVLGAATVALTVPAALLSRAGSGTIALATGIASLAALAGTSAAFWVAVGRFPMRRRAGLGLGLALAAWPIAALLAVVVLAPR